ncbi:hypothetical protein Mapa_005997 [Marchantia paleacea]|nr:hypothetical protein Mapa_005997 [Marchantia paleacea]
MASPCDLDSIRERDSKSVRHTAWTNDEQVEANSPPFPVPPTSFISEEARSSLGESSSPSSRASSVMAATVNTTPRRPSTARVIACASLATITAAPLASWSIVHSTPLALLLNIAATALSVSSFTSWSCMLLTTFASACTRSVTKLVFSGFMSKV